MGKSFLSLPGIHVDGPNRDVSVSSIPTYLLLPPSHCVSRELVHEFRHRTLVLVKALILQRKVSFTSCSPEQPIGLGNSRYYFTDIQSNGYVHINTR